MELEEQSSHEDMKTPKWTWSPLYGPIHKGNSCPDCNAWVEHIFEHAIDGIPSLSVAQQYMQQVVRCKYDHRWDDCDKAQMEGHGLQIGHVHSALQMLATVMEFIGLHDIPYILLSPDSQLYLSIDKFLASPDHHRNLSGFVPNTSFP